MAFEQGGGQGGWRRGLGLSRDRLMATFGYAGVSAGVVLALAAELSTRVPVARAWRDSPLQALEAALLLLVVALMLAVVAMVTATCLLVWFVSLLARIFLPAAAPPEVARGPSETQELRSGLPPLVDPSRRS